MSRTRIQNIEVHRGCRLQFVARFTENNLDGENLARIYSRVSKGHGARDAPADRDASAAAAGPSRADTADDDDYVAPDSSRRRSHSEARAPPAARVSYSLMSESHA